MAKRCFTYVTVPHLGSGFVQSCVSILEHFPSADMLPQLVLPQCFASIGDNVKVVEALPRLVRKIPSSFLSHHFTNWKFAKEIAEANERDVAYFWPCPPVALVERARSRGMLVVREMINSTLRNAKDILDVAYDRLDLSPSHGITEQSVRREIDELNSYDYVFASNSLVEDSLLSIGMHKSKILSTTFGWEPARFIHENVKQSVQNRFRVLFVGTIGVRKGVFQLLNAWVKAGVDGELVLAGHVEEVFKPILRPFLEREDIKYVGFVSDPGRLYKSADIFAFPTLEEGGPQVTYEASGLGLPVITTPMGSARMVQNGANGFVVAPFDVEDLAAKIRLLHREKDLRYEMSKMAARSALDFTYERVGLNRGKQLYDVAL